MKLGVNIDHIASIRQIRSGVEPEPVYAAFICEAAGADGIVVHLREDRRHIKDRDLYLLKKVVKTKLNLEMSAAAEIVNIACKVRPQQATLVPEKRKEITTEGGLDVAGNIKKVAGAINKLRKHNIAISLFIDPVKSQIDASVKLGVEMIELHTGRYADAKTESSKRLRLAELERAAGYGHRKGLTVNAGHGLDYYNVKPVARIPRIEELNIGYSIVCRAALVGLDRAVREMKALIK
ncbi:MAG: pyridoxine 5'-phosphate synthase [Candidatus Omnitrophota bacterium]